MKRLFSLQGLVLSLLLAVTLASCEQGDPNKRTYTVNGVQFRMVKVEGGTFTMGGTEEQEISYENEFPLHEVTLSDYAIGETEVTQELWAAVMGGSAYQEEKNLPMEYVSWEDCRRFIAKLNDMTGEHFRLPTEAEWEYAARGGQKSQGFQFSGSNVLADVAWYWENSEQRTHPVATKQPNELGLYDMNGNVWEWCQDWYGSYGSGDQTNPEGPTEGTERVDRGGSWTSSAGTCRVSYRGNYNPAKRNSYLGLRLAM